MCIHAWIEDFLYEKVHFMFIFFFQKAPPIIAVHTTCSWDIMCQKWEGDCGLWVLNEIIKKTYTESLKKIVGAVWELPAK